VASYHFRIPRTQTNHEPKFRRLLALCRQRAQTLTRGVRTSGHGQCCPDRELFSCPASQRQPHVVNLDGARRYRRLSRACYASARPWGPRAPPRGTLRSPHPTRLYLQANGPSPTSGPEAQGFTCCGHGIVPLLLPNQDIGKVRIKVGILWVEAQSRAIFLLGLRILPFLLEFRPPRHVLANFILPRLRRRMNGRALRPLGARWLGPLGRAQRRKKCLARACGP